MKTAVSIPDAIYRAAEKFAKKNRLSRSKLYARALAEFLKKARGRATTERLNEIADRIDTSLDPVVAKLQSQALDREDW